MEMPKFLQKAKDWVTGESGPAIKVGAAADNPEEYEKAKDAQKTVEAERAKAAEAEKKRLDTVSKATSEGIGIKEAADKTGENLSETQKALASKNDVTDKVDEAAAAQEQEATPTDDDEADFEEEVGNDEGVSTALETKDPNDAKEATLNYLTKKGLVKINADGSIDFGRLKQTPSSIFSRVGTVLSALLSVMTGGAIPPVNFYKLSGMEGEDEERKKLYQNLMSKLAETSGQIASTKEKATQSPEEAEKAGEYDYKASGAYAKDMQGLKNTIETMRESNANAKDYAEYMIEINAKSPKVLKDFLQESGISKEEYINLKNILDKGYWTSAELQKWGQRLDNISKGVGAVSNVVGTAAKVASPAKAAAGAAGL